VKTPPVRRCQDDELTCETENERLPVELGWKKQANVIQLTDVMAMSSLIGNATSLFTGSTTTAHSAKRDLHTFGSMM
jgi:hypothetical protein